ncbi:MAG: tRNA (N6-threonylcarbamoyladenosine(37)-N6)-methyltransferase TrmO [Spirochaetaceae bacterium]|nr:MAG: tRNA (N6-threonylcarbamoyladenosine(37)-N6)-methyltransferase TrmO [Spirochaetaceae bacterium]
MDVRRRSGEPGLHPICFDQIGVVHSPFDALEQLPRQPWEAPHAEGFIELFAAYEDGLHLIERRPWILVVSFLHRVRNNGLHVVTHSGGEPIGVFGARTPYRPNPIAVSRMQLLGREGRRLRVRQMDLLDGTPVIDIKTYIDHREHE